MQKTITTFISEFFKQPVAVVFYMWAIGFVINNAYLSNYGAYSYDIFDWSNLTSAFAFVLIVIWFTAMFACTRLCVAAIKRSVTNWKSTDKQDGNGSAKAKKTLIRKNSIWISLTSSYLLLLLLVLLPSSSIPWSQFIGICETCNWNLPLTFICIILLAICCYYVYDPLNIIKRSYIPEESKTDQKDGDNISVEISLACGRDEKIEFNKKNETAKNKESGNNNNNNKKILPIYNISIFILAVLVAHFYGKNIHGLIPKDIGGGQTNRVSFSSNDYSNKFIAPDRIFKLVDETDDSYLLLDEKNSRILGIPSKIREEATIRFHYESDLPDKKQPILKLIPDVHDEVAVSGDIASETCDPILLFAADAHASLFMKEGSKNRYNNGFDKLEKLAKHWQEKYYNGYYFLLGDMLEETADEKENEEHFSANLKKMKTILKKFKSAHKRFPKIILGNNDFSTQKQRETLLDGLKDYGFKGSLPVWSVELTKKISVIGFYLPAAKQPIDDAFFDDAYSNQLSLLRSLLERVAQNDELKLLFLLVHQGLTEANTWSGQYELSNELNDEQHEKWKKFVGDARKILWSYDPQSSNSGKKTFEIVVVCGHFHQGFLTRNLDGIDHISCPSLTVGTRNPSKFEKGSYLKCNVLCSDNGAIRGLDVDYHNIKNDNIIHRTRICFNPSRDTKGTFTIK